MGGKSTHEKPQIQKHDIEKLYTTMSNNLNENYKKDPESK